MKRINDIEPIAGDKVRIEIDGTSFDAAKGETVLSTLSALGFKKIGKNDHGRITGAYCGMGVCYCCAVRINEKEKQRACQKVVKEGMVIKTQSNRLDVKGLLNGE
jgi:hydrogen cyanide synthase HcnA